MLNFKNKRFYFFYMLFFAGIAVYLTSCGKPAVVNKRLDLSPLKNQNMDISKTFSNFQNIIILSKKNNDIAGTWDLLSENYKIAEFNNVIDFLKSSWSSHYSRIFSSIADASLNEIKFLNEKNATLTLLNENENNGRPIYLILNKENGNWKIEDISGINPSNEIYNKIISDLNAQKKDFPAALDNLANLVENGEYGSAYQFSMLLLKKYPDIVSRRETEKKSFINAILKISNFYIYSFHKTNKKNFLLDSVQLLESLFKLNYYDNRIFFNAGMSHFLNNNPISANIFFDRALQFVKPSPENSEYIKSIISYIIDIHLIQNEWNVARGKFKIWESAYADFPKILNHIGAYKQNWESVIKYNCADANLKYKIIQSYKSENFQKTEELIKSFLEKYEDSFYKNSMLLLGCMTKYFVYSSNQNSDDDNLLKSFRDYCSASLALKKNEYAPLIYSLLIESYLKDSGNPNDYNAAYSLIKQFQEKMIAESFDDEYMSYFNLTAANCYRYLKYWKKSIDEYASLKQSLSLKKYKTQEEEKILKLINTILEKQVNLGYIASPYLGVSVEQNSIYGNLIVKNVVDSRVFLKNDIILEINNIKISDLFDYQIIINSLKIDSPVKIKILRAGKIISESVNISDKL
ncbi:MAG TPA: PDZ domain-containing protein [bacterium]|nr:PDZ domain-containing protein [bacterium]